MTKQDMTLLRSLTGIVDDCARVHDWKLRGIIPWIEEDFLIAAGVCTTSEGDCRLMTVKVKNAD